MSISIRRASWRWASTGILGLVALVALVALTGPATPSLPAGAPSAALPPAGVLTPPVAAEAAAHPARTIGVIVQAHRGADPAAVVARAGGRVTMALPIINGVAAQLRAGAAPGVAATPGVRAVSLDAPVGRTDAGDAARNLDDKGRSGSGEERGDERGRTKGDIVAPHVFSVRADDAWKRGWTGKGVGVAVIDTGIAGDLADFDVSATDGTSRVVANAVVTGENSPTAGDGFGHGTHVAGLIAGNSFFSGVGQRGWGNWMGIAPQADLVAVKVGDDDGNVTLANVIAGLQFVVDKKDELNIKVVNLSLSSTVAESPSTDPLDAAVEVAWFNGLTVVAAAGNRGAAGDAVGYAPGNDPYVITVGAVDDQGTRKTGDDVLADWSSRGTTQTGVSKPEVLAPGARMVSTLSPGSDFATLCPQCVVDDRYFRVGGTSMAAAVVSGAAAAIAQANPDWTPDQIKGAMVRTLRDGIVDVFQAAKRNGRDTANTGARQSELLEPYDPTAAGFDRYSWTRYSWSRYSWSRYSWSTATGAQNASWSRYSWTCDCVAPQPEGRPAPAEDKDEDVPAEGADAPAEDKSIPVKGDAETDRYSWSRYSWSRYSWSRYSWTRYSWTASFTK